MAGRKDRQRKLERERYLRREARRAERNRRNRQWTISILAAAAVVAVGVVSVLFFSSSTKPSVVAQPSSPAVSPSPSASPSLSPSASAPAVTEPARHCAYTANPSPATASPPAARKVGRPPARPDYKASYTATIHTNRGNIVISLLNSKATCTVNSFVYLAARKYFDNTHCHRLTTSGIFVLQCGDPTGTGSGGPGYRFNDENLAGAKYVPGTVAMANGGPNTNGSQFFLVYKYSPLGASYTPFGTITSGLNIIQKVAKVGSDNSGGTGDGHPKEQVVIKSVTIKKT